MDIIEGLLKEVIYDNIGILVYCHVIQIDAIYSGNVWTVIDPIGVNVLSIASGFIGESLWVNENI